MNEAGSGISLFIYQMVDPHRIYICTAITLAAPTHSLHDTVAFDSGSEARYVLVRRQVRDLGIYPYTIA